MKSKQPLEEKTPIISENTESSHVSSSTTFEEESQLNITPVQNIIKENSSNESNQNVIRENTNSPEVNNNLLIQILIIFHYF